MIGRVDQCSLCGLNHEAGSPSERDSMSAHSSAKKVRPSPRRRITAAARTAATPKAASTRSRRRTQAITGRGSRQLGRRRATIARDTLNTYRPFSPGLATAIASSKASGPVL